MPEVGQYVFTVLIITIKQQDMDSECSERRARESELLELPVPKPHQPAVSEGLGFGIRVARFIRGYIYRFGSSGLFGVYIGFRARVDCSGFGGFCR